MEGFFHYITNPFIFENKERFTFKTFLKAMALGYLLSSLASIFVIILRKIDCLPEYNDLIPLNSIEVYIAVVLIIPLLEEIVFRLNLKVSRKNIAVALSVLTVVLFKLLFLREVHFYIYLAVIPVFCLINFLFNLFDFQVQKIEAFIKSHFKYFFHLSAILFGMLHITNYENIYWYMIAIMPLITAPNITSGYILGYVRMKYGFIYGWLIHSSINFISVMFVIHKGLIALLILSISLSSYYVFLRIKRFTL